jgi:hypothetical protein
MREKKTWVKTIPQDEILSELEYKNTAKALKVKTEGMMDSELFSVNVNKKNLKEKREKLLKDRFKEKERQMSKSEQRQVKTLAEKLERKSELPT